MGILRLSIAAVVAVMLGPGASANPDTGAVPATIVREVLSLPDDQLDYGRAKLAFDRIIDPSIGADATLAQVDRLVNSASAMAGPRASAAERLSALRRVIYESGDWNGGNPFSYDHDDPRGENIRNKLLSTYLATRRGNCVSMPILFLIAGERMGLDLSLSTAPLHIFLRYREEDRREINLEATSGALPARMEWYRQNSPMSDRSIESGLYMRTLSRREAVAHMATTVTDFLIDEGRFHEAIEVAEIILQHDPRDAYTMVKLGTAYAHLMQVEFVEPYPDPGAIPPHLRRRYVMLAQRNQMAFQAAEALGWEPTQ